MADQQAYVPGVCNINRTEIAYRQKVGYIGLSIFIVLLVALFLLKAPMWVRIILFIPAFLSATGFLQAKNRFCVGYAAAGKQNASEGSSTAQAVTDTTAVAKDKARAKKMNIQALLIAVVITIVVVAIPNF